MPYLMNPFSIENETNNSSNSSSIAMVLLKKFLCNDIFGEKTVEINFTSDLRSNMHICNMHVIFLARI